MGRMPIRLQLTILALVGASSVSAADYPKPLPDEPTPAVVTLPAHYPANWMIVQDFNFNSIVDGRAAIVDIAAASNNLKGTLPVTQFGNVLVSNERSEIYVAETFYSRFTRGVRTDAITIWDMASLNPKGEIILPGNKRYQSVTIKNNFQLVNGGKWALVYNFTPAQSVTVVDLAGRKVLGDIDMPGCADIYPVGERGFAAMCSDGTFTSMQLDAAGALASAKTSASINNIEDDAMFMMPAMVGRTAWFATFRGNLHGIDLSGSEARDLGSFAIVPNPKAVAGWRPSGWQLIASDAAGKLYVLMNPNGREGSHKDPATEVWIIDPIKKAKIGTIALGSPGISVEITRQATPMMIVARADSSIDVYDLATGKRVRTLGATIVFNPMVLMPVTP